MQFIVYDESRMTLEEHTTCKQESTDCQSWSGPVRDLEIILGPGPVRGPDSNRSVREQPVLVSWIPACNCISINRIGVFGDTVLFIYKLVYVQ